MRRRLMDTSVVTLACGPTPAMVWGALVVLLLGLLVVGGVGVGIVKAADAATNAWRRRRAPKPTPPLRF